MKKKFIFFAVLLLTIMGGVKLNVLNAQEQYRIKSVSTGKYITIFNNTNSNNSGTNGGVGVADYAESNAQIFTFETNSSGYYVKSADGYYIKCYDWNVDAYSTSNPMFNATTLVGFDFDGGTFQLRKLGGSKYFKVEQVSGVYYIFCDCDGTNGTIETWQLEPVITDDGIIPASPTNLAAAAIDHKSISLTWTAGDENALKYNIYQGGVNIGSTTETTYTVNDLAAETNYCFTVEAVRGVNVSQSHSNEDCATTGVAPKTQKIIFSLKDSFGDGWNGNYFMISYEGYSERLDLSSGSSATYERELPQGVEVTLTYTKGDAYYTYPDENSFEIKYEDGEVIWSKAKGELSITISHTFTVKSNDPSIEANLASIDFGTVRTGNFWTEKETPSYNVEVTAKNTTIKSVAIDNNFFTADAELANAANQTSFSFNVSYDKTAEAGAKSGNIVVTYMNGEEEATVEIPMTATAYVPAQGDVVENPIEANFDEDGVYTYTINSLDGFYDDYIFSANEQYDADAPDMVFSFTLTEDAIVTISNLGWSALYGEFTVENGPQYNVSYPESNTLLSAGTYYAICSPNSWDLPSEFSITKSSIPAPIISYNNPQNGAANENNPALTWNMQYAETYKVMLGTSEDALEEVAAETATEGQTEYSFQTSELQNKLQNNTKYYWQIVATNKAGTTTGEVRSFVTLLDVPQITSATSFNLYPEGTATITWEAVENATSYKVYNGEWNVLATLEATETSYELSGLEYNMTGHNITVTATQEGLGESLKSEPVIVKVAGTFPLTVNVKDSQGNAIEGATVTVDMAKAYDEFGVQVAYMESVTTDAEGKVMLTLSILGGYAQYGSSWLTPYYTLAVSKSPYTATSTTVSTAYGIPTSRDITLYLPTPSSVYPENYENMLLAGDEFILNWNAVDGATGYNVYRQGEYSYSTWTYEYELLETVTENKYTTIAEYNEAGSKYAVSALFEGGLESDKAVTSDYIYVLGTGDVKGVVTDTEGNLVAGAALELSGTTGFGDDIHIGETSADGTFIFENVIEGTYSLTVSHYNYEVATVSGISVNYNIELNLETIQLTPKAYIENVTVTADNNGNVSWTGSYEKYNVYRRNVENPQELATVATELEATNTTDAEWETLEAGTYQYGVAALVTSEGFGKVVEEDFEDYNTGNQPTGWILPGNYSAVSVGSYNSGSKSFYTYYYNTGNYYFIMPYPINPNKATMSFYYKCYPYNGTVDKLKVCYSTTLSKDATWTEFDFEGSSASWEQVNIDLGSITEETIYIAFLMESVYANGIYIDDIVITGMTATSIETQIVWSDEVVKQGPAEFVGEDEENPTAWDVVANWKNGKKPTEGSDVIISANAVISGAVNVANLTINNGDSYPYNTLTVANGGVLTVTGTISQQSNYLLVLEEGGQIFQNNEGVTARFRMSIDNPSDWSDETNKDGWQFISMPMADVTYDWFTGADDEYDLYKYDGSQDLEWLNHKAGSFAETEFISGKGYLASLKEANTATVYGTLNTATSKTWGQYYVNDKDLANFQLIGNPFTFDMDMTKLNSYETMVAGYAVVNNGEYEYKTDGTVKVGEGFFVKVATNYAMLSYNHYTRFTRESNNSLNITATGKAGKDNVVINLAGKSEGFDKLQNFNDEIATVYVAENGKNYGIYNCDADVQEVELSFNAATMGNYTIAAQPKGKFESVILVDRFTGVETNLLVEDYNFTATSSDKHDRFIVRLAKSQEPTANGNFAYVSGEDLILNIEGSVQIIDVMGRIVYSNDVTSDNNRISVSNFNDGTYIVRVINEEGVKVQKVVVY